MVVGGEVLVEVPQERGPERWFPLGPGQFFGELGLHLRAAALEHGEGGPQLRADRGAAPRDAEAHRLGRVGPQAGRRDLPQARGAHLPRADAPRGASSTSCSPAGVQRQDLRRRRGAVRREGDAARRPVPHPARLGDDLARASPGARWCCRTCRRATTWARWRSSRKRRASATVKAAVTTEAVILDARSLRARCSRAIPQWREEMETRFLDRLRANAAMEAQPDPGNIISFLMQQGVGEATDVLLIDETLCVRCNNCEKACADVHDGTSRLDREAGPTFAQIHVPTSCRHCEHPHCMKECPPDAIHRSAERRGLHQRHLHRLRQLRAQLPLRRDPARRDRSAAAPAEPLVVAAAGLRARAGHGAAR